MRKIYSIVSYCKRTYKYRHDFFYGDCEEEALMNFYNYTRRTHEVLSIVEIPNRTPGA